MVAWKGVRTCVSMYRFLARLGTFVTPVPIKARSITPWTLLKCRNLPTRKDSITWQRTVTSSQPLYTNNFYVHKQAVQRATRLIKSSHQMNPDDTAAQREVDETIDETSGRVLAWAEGAAAAAAGTGAVAGGENEDKHRQLQVLPSGKVNCLCAVHTVRWPRRGPPRGLSQPASPLHSYVARSL